MKIILLGAPGCGKGTQAQEICTRFGLPHISTGEILRENIRKGTEIGLKIKDVIESGHLCPDEIMLQLVKERLSSEDCEKGYLLDGFPRDVAQAKALDWIDVPDKVIDIEVDYNIIEKRITGRRSCINCNGVFHIDNIGDAKTCPNCGGELITRKDDTVDTVRSRLAVYKERTLPLKEYYEKQNKLFRVNGNDSVEKVFSEIVKVL